MPALEPTSSTNRSALTADRRFNAGFKTALAALALIIGTGGVYATTAASAAQRTKEIGIRMALGASPARVVNSISGRTARVVLIGTAIGLFGAWCGSTLLTSVVFGLEPTDPLVYAVPAFVLAAGGGTGGDLSRVARRAHRSADHAPD